MHCTFVTIKGVCNDGCDNGISFSDDVVGHIAIPAIISPVVVAQTCRSHVPDYGAKWLFTGRFMFAQRLVSAVLVASGALCMSANADDVKLGGETAQTSCIEVTIDGQKTPDMSCLNQELVQKAAAARAIPVIAPVDAHSASVQTGGFNQAAMAQQYGQNFGKSAEPYRPPAPVFAPPVGGR